MSTKDSKKNTPARKPDVSRRKFLTGAAAATGAAMAAFPMIARAQDKKGDAKAAAPAVVSSAGPTIMRWHELDESLPYWTIGTQVKKKSPFHHE